MSTITAGSIIIWPGPNKRRDMATTTAALSARRGCRGRASRARLGDSSGRIIPLIPTAMRIEPEHEPDRDQQQRQGSTRSIASRPVSPPHSSIPRNPPHRLPLTHRLLGQQGPAHQQGHRPLPSICRCGSPEPARSRSGTAARRLGRPAGCRRAGRACGAARFALAGSSARSRWLCALARAPRPGLDLRRTQCKNAPRTGPARCSEDISAES